ncbi:MAG: hypothetical protein ABI585_16160 [Betaproteobacteria bacterium]
MRDRRFGEAIAVGECKRAALLVFVGCVSLSVGVLVYLADRVASHAALIPSIDALGGLHLFGALGQWLPSFVHPLAFSLFTAAVLKRGAAAYGGACAFWAAVDVAFEVGQHPALAATWTAALHGELGEWAIARATLRYFLLGTFDPYDVCAAMLGALLAGAALLFFDYSQGGRHASS